MYIIFLSYIFLHHKFSYDFKSVYKQIINIDFSHFQTKKLSQGQNMII